ncbi:hypothetical protein CAEBREN_16740 [Caenorhabditis brenneri]|uniref:BTB domain-containing protein n=1 Tax=Caenorhabditis brenneri TaxID=135651 RepID=G0MW02_CAEBE|nr:hypothetical protein CAEBREN_16740 [Caenorhabditis brenneri]
MGDPNSGVIRQKLENVSELTTEIANELDLETNVFEIFIRKNEIEEEEFLGVNLTCNRCMFSNVWSCNASVRVSLVGFAGASDDKSTFSMNFLKNFTRFDDEITISTFRKWSELMDPKNFFVVGNTALVEVAITVNSCTGWNKFHLETFDTPNDQLTDAILLVGGKKCYVGKQILACHSGYFKALFYGDFKEKTEEEIKIEDVVHSEFVDLLNCVYPTDFEIDDENVSHILKLADWFEVYSVLKKAEDYLMNTSEMDIVDKLKFAEQYKLGRLQDNCLDSLEDPKVIIDWQNHEHYKELGDVTLSLLFQKIAQLDKKDKK